MVFRTIDSWAGAISDLGVSVAGPSIIKLANGISLEVDMIVENFGGPKGTIVVNEYDKIKNIKEAIRESGYALSCFDAPSRPEVYNRQVKIEVLLDWGWTGRLGEEPAWYRDAIEQCKER